ncbi:EF-hand domain-containing protein [Streptomyces sp. NPDC050315]|uniref:EF-hand domain-containing protein n=1 Tax=Streptomyces sp. NPDC050315 TaxID=3155039 RepID=UPI00344640FB
MTTETTPEAIHSKCDRMFALLDVDGNGHIDQEDIDLMAGKILQGSQVPLDSAKATQVKAEYAAWWRALAAHADADGDGRITRDEFRASMSGLAPDDPAIRDSVRGAVDAAFTAMDADDDGQIPVATLVAMFTTGGVAPEDAVEAARFLDRDGDGTITRDEYATAWLDYFTTIDPAAPANHILGRIG